MLRYALLGILNYRPMNGYELKQFMDSATNHFWHAKLSQIYTTLKALEAEGMLISTVLTQEDRPDKRMYTITQDGRNDLRAWLEAPLIEIEPTKEPLLLKVFFAAQLDKAQLIAHLRVQRSLHQAALNALRGETAAVIAHAASQNKGREKDGLLWEAVRRAGELSEEAYVRWLDETIHMIEENF